MNRLLLVALLLAAAATPADARRSHSARAQFARAHPCPSTGLHKPHCPGYVIDHRTALACGGVDAPYNMQWQTIAEAKAKDKWERHGCTRR